MKLQLTHLPNINNYSIGKLSVGVCAWKGLNSLRAYVAKNERLHILRLLGVNTQEFGKYVFIGDVYL